LSIGDLDERLANDLAGLGRRGDVAVCDLAAELGAIACATASA
jgi:hypothetical protein